MVLESNGGGVVGDGYGVSLPGGTLSHRATTV
jgi:hypothetical protein